MFSTGDKVQLKRGGPATTVYGLTSTVPLPLTVSNAYGSANNTGNTERFSTLLHFRSQFRRYLTIVLLRPAVESRLARVVSETMPFCVPFRWSAQRANDKFWSQRIALC